MPFIYHAGKWYPFAQCPFFWNSLPIWYNETTKFRHLSSKENYLKWTFCIPAVVALVSASLLSCSEKEPSARSLAVRDKKVFVSGSAAVMPLLKILAGEFMKREKEIEVVFLPDSHSDVAIVGTTEEEYDIGAISRERMPDEKVNPLRYLHLARDGLVFAVNPNLDIVNLSIDQIRDIYTGKMSNWSEVGGPDAKIVVIDRPELSSAKLAFRKHYLPEDALVTSEAVVVERPWQVTDSIEWIANSIGYTSLGEIVSERPRVNILSVNGVKPTRSNVKDGSYKFLRPFGLVLGPHPKVATMRFVNFIFSDAGSRIIENSGYIPQRYEILIGIVPEQDVMVQNQRYQPLADYLSHKLGERFSVKLKLFSAYIEVCRALADGSINAAFLGSYAYTTVSDVVDVIARPDYHGISMYRGLIFVRADSGIKNLAQMRGKRLVMAGRTTTAGYVFPLYHFKQQGIQDYRAYFSQANFVGTHDDVILAVLHREADVGAAKDLILRMFMKENPELESAFHILEKSPPVPNNAFVVRKNLNLPCFDCHSSLGKEGKIQSDLPAKFDVGATIGEFLAAMPQDAEGRVALSSLGGASGFLPTTDADYEDLYRMLKEIGVDPKSALSANEVVE
ncbi:MAG: phosphate/phosphite/phosphonate ABC transporter substrate-binding protein [Candidatus Abyssobacteria bacterium SURF_5]|uniref:Phosphate/phosphite/phosphonate ABC transporter substrate-binding protein n=1 Tax=Abyssobacteria bacterium (strain SURF_5) TaxID=2093360 RepID=A0A3A4NH03_ABYX5|nr:MAG: phosphate/phosphite/phosphonate ABC transporter substrate-binding protein [Candidatus Abyssubacteria bacterium SURF_5]